MVTIRLQQIALATVSTVVLVVAGGPAPAAANLIGTSVTGMLNFGGDTTTNYFDPANGFVPAGAANSIGPTVTIVDPGVEFQYNDGFTAIDADFGPDSLSVLELLIQISDGATGFSPISMTFTGLGSAGALINVEQISNTFPDLIVAFDANSVSVSTPPDSILPFPPSGSYSAELHITQAVPVDEPGTLLLLPVALLGLAFRKRLCAIPRLALCPAT